MDYTLTCPDDNCRITFTAPAGLVDRAKDDDQDVYCPNGHSMNWRRHRREKHEQELKVEREAKERFRDRSRDLATERWELMAMIKTCPACGWRSRKQRPDRIRADFAEHLSEKHGLAITEDLEQALLS